MSSAGAPEVRSGALIITAAIVGAELSRDDTPHLPLTPAEMAAEAKAAAEAGASVIHVHARDSEGRPTQSAEWYARILEAIRAETDAVLQVSTGGAVWMSAEERLQVLSLSPEMATLTTGTVNFGRDVFLNPPEMIEAFAREMRRRGVRPEVEIFEVGMIDNAQRLVRQGLLEPPLHFDLVMGVPGGIPGTPKQLLHLVECLPPGSSWTVAGIGRAELPLAAMAIVLGGHVRVGFEDNIYYARGQLARSNAELVARVGRLAAELGRPLASPAEARAMLRIPAAPVDA